MLLMAFLQPTPLARILHEDYVKNIHGTVIITACSTFFPKYDSAVSFIFLNTIALRAKHLRFATCTKGFPFLIRQHLHVPLNFWVVESIKKAIQNLNNNSIVIYINTPA